MSLVLVDGCFDPLHPGHLEYLALARKIATDVGLPLVCKVAPNRIVAEKHVPLLTMEERGALVRSHVDRVVVDERGVDEVIVAERPARYVKGVEWKGRLPASHVEACRTVGAKMVFVETVWRRSSTGMLKAWERETEDRAVRAMETFIRTQRPPGPFDEQYFKTQGFTLAQRREIEGIHPGLVRDVLRPRGRVLDYGCGPGHFVTLLREAGVDAVGYDPWVRGKTDTDRLTSHYDVVVCREVLEHVPLRLWLGVVGRVVGLSSRLVYLTTRFHHDPGSAWAVEDRDELDPTHITLATPTLLRGILTLLGCRRREDLEGRLDHQRKGRVFVYETPAAH